MARQAPLTRGEEDVGRRCQARSEAVSRPFFRAPPPIPASSAFAPLRHLALRDGPRPPRHPHPGLSRPRVYVRGHAIAGPSPGGECLENCPSSLAAFAAAAILFDTARPDLRPKTRPAGFQVPEAESPAAAGGRGSGRRRSGRRLGVLRAPLGADSSRLITGAQAAPRR